MSDWITVTDRNGKGVFVNMDHVTLMRRKKNVAGTELTLLYFSDAKEGETEDVKETPQEIVSKLRAR
jgi:hypothetical protein